MPVQDPHDVLVIGGTLAGAAAALAATRQGARTRLLIHGAHPAPETPPIPEDPTPNVETSIKDSDVPAPSEPTAFSFRARRVRRWLDELGIDNDDAWAPNLHEALLDRLRREGAAVDEASIAVRLIGDNQQGISGAVLVDGEDCTTHQADTTILAGGGIQYLWPDQGDASAPSGWALALRAELPIGDAGRVAWQEPGEDAAPFRFTDGVRADARGRFQTPGVAVCGEAMACPWHADPEIAFVEDVVRGLEAGGFQAAPAQPGDPELVPLVDSDMPPGFANVKLGRLRGLLQTHAGPGADAQTLKTGHAESLALRGEFADYARARAQTELQILHQCADVALAHVDARLG